MSTVLWVIVAVIAVAAILYWGFRSEQKEAHHLDGLHITPQHGADEKKQQ